MTDGSLALLLEVQAADSRLDQLRYRRETLVERAALAKAEGDMAALDQARAPLDTQIAELARQQRRLEDEVATIEARIEAETKRLYSGAVTVPRELTAIQEELDGLGRRQRHLEDQELEVMEAMEPLVAETSRLQLDRDGLERRAEELRSALAAAEAAVDAEIADAVALRDGLGQQVPAELLARYDALRARLGGVAVARLEGAQCSGCHLTLPAVELDAVRRAPADAVVTHEECGRILIRT